MHNFKGVCNLKLEIIAELAQGFEGRYEQARLLLKAAASAGADAGKFQLVYADELATPDYKYYDLFTSLEMNDDEWQGLAEYAKELDIKLYVDIFGKRSLALSEQIGLSVVKLHGTDISNVGLLEQVATSSVPKIMLGAGGAFASELERALEMLASKEVIVLLGFQGYPTPNASNQIARVRLLVDKYNKSRANVTIGFADHAPPDRPVRYALAATSIGAGATVIEKHLTLGQVMKLEDYESALNPDEFSEFCEVMNECVDAFGVTGDSESFGMDESELGYRKMIRRHVIASRDLSIGTCLSSEDLILKRCSSEQVITDLELTYGKTLKHAVNANSPLSPSDID